MALRAIESKQLRRIAGEAAIQPDAETAAAMVAAGRTKVISSWALVIDTAGWVQEVAPMTSTGFIAYDVRIAAGLKTWRFEPFLDEDGFPIPIATTVTFVWKPA
jgi:hypothetical protein